MTIERAARGSGDKRKALHKLPRRGIWTLGALQGIPDQDTAAVDYLALSRLIRSGLPLSVMDNLKEAGVDTNCRNMIILPRTLQHRAAKGEPALRLLAYEDRPSALA